MKINHSGRQRLVQRRKTLPGRAALPELSVTMRRPDELSLLCPVS